MTIPSTKASTANVDAGSDKISLARPDIKQNIDNVNEIIDHLGTVNAVPATLSSSFPSNFFSNYYETITGNTRRRAFTDIDDLDSIVSSVSDSTGLYYEITLGAGTYRARWLMSVVDDDHHNVTFYNKTDDTGVLTYSYDEIGTTADAVTPETAVAFTLASTKTFEFRFTTGVVTQDGMTGTIRLELTKYR